MLDPQNGDCVVTIDSVTSPHPMYSFTGWVRAYMHARLSEYAIALGVTEGHRVRLTPVVEVSER